MDLIITLSVLFIAGVLFAIGKVRSDVVALGALIVLLLAGVLTPQEALSGFGNSVVIMMIALFVVGGAILQTGLAKTLSRRVLRLAGGSETKLFLAVMLLASGIGAFVSNTGTVALLMPIVVSIAQGARTSPARLLMPLAFASSLGGMLTLIGTPPNLVVQNTLLENGQQGFGFFSFLPVGLIALGVGIVFLLPATKFFLAGRRPAEDDGKAAGKAPGALAAEYGVASQLTCLRLNDDSSAREQSVEALDVQRRYGLCLLEVRAAQRGQKSWLRNVEQHAAMAATRLHAGDVLYLSGPHESAERLAADYGMVVESAALDFYQLGMAEIVLLSSSHLIGQQLRTSGLRAKFNINVLGIRRNGRHITEDLAQQTFHMGDVLLVQGSWENIERLRREDEQWVVLGEPAQIAERITLDYKAPTAALIMLLMVCAMVFDFIPIEPVTAVMAAGLLMVLTGCFRSVEAAYKTIRWESIVLIAAMMPMSVALEKTGASAWLAHTLTEVLGAYGSTALLAGVYFTTSLLSLFISNTASAVLMAPIAMSAALGAGASPQAFMMAVTLGASMCFASPFSTPPNALVMQAGGYRFIDYIRVGLPLQIIIGLVMMVVLPLLF